MENFELYIYPETINPINGRFRKRHIPFNKGKKWTDYMDMRKAKRVKKCLEIGRMKGNRDKLHEYNKKQIVGIKDGKLTAFDSATNAAKILQTKGVKVARRNICAVCHGENIKVGKYSYTRKKAGGFRWFFAEDIEKYKDLILT